MSNLKLIMSQGNKTAELEIEQSDEKQRNDAVMGLFRFFGDKAATAVLTINSAKAEPQVKQNAAPQKVQPASPAPLSAGGTSAPPQSHKSVKPPLIHSERTLKMPIGEITGSTSNEAVSDEPEHYRTGIKYKDGVPHYRLRYWCKNLKCRDKGTDYILPDEMIINCRTCGTAHVVRPAAPKGERDDWGNFFIADALADQ